jgi:hypothetical protein
MNVKHPAPSVPSLCQMGAHCIPVYATHLATRARQGDSRFVCRDCAEYLADYGISITPLTTPH